MLPQVVEDHVELLVGRVQLSLTIRARGVVDQGLGGVEETRSSQGGEVGSAFQRVFLRIKLKDFVDGLVVAGEVEHRVHLVVSDEPTAVDRALSGQEDRHLDLLHLVEHLLAEVDLGNVVLKRNCVPKCLLAKQTWKIRNCSRRCA